MGSAHANLGVAWERLIADWNDRYRAEDPSRAVVYQTQAPIRMLTSPRFRDGRFTGVLAGDGPPDFQGFLQGGTGVSFDAKDCGGARWSFGQLQRHQARDLEAVHLLGHHAFIALRMGDGEGWVVPWGELGPRWWTWHEEPALARREQRPPRRVQAALTLADLQAWARWMPEPGNWLLALLR